MVKFLKTSNPFRASTIFSTKIMGVTIFTIFFVMVMVNQIEMVINSHRLVPLPAGDWSHIRIVPLPMNITNGTDIYFLNDSFTFEANSDSKILQKAINRYTNLIFTKQSSSGQDYSIAGFNFNHTNININPNIINRLIITIESKDETLQMGVDESYSLILEYKGFELNSKTIFGALRGLESFSQMVEYGKLETSSSSTSSSSYYIQHCPWRIIDRPRFQHRGTLLDTSNHFIPISTIQSFIDTLSYSKFNVFHWHIIDSQSFPMESKLFPKLWEGAWSKDQTYSYKDIETVVEYSKERGIRVIVEIGMPGHASSWGVGYPEVLPANYSRSDKCNSIRPQKCNIPLDPSSPDSYNIAFGLIKETKQLFPDNLIHIGGDKTVIECYENSNQIKEWMNEMGMSDYKDAVKYFQQQVFEKISQEEDSRSPIIWEDTYDAFKTELPKQSIVQIYNELSTLQQAVKDGYRVIVSNSLNFNLDLNSTWQSFYTNDFTTNITDSEQLDFILGGETCFWGEKIVISDGSILDDILSTTTWMRNSAASERLWSPSFINRANLIDVKVRLERFNTHLKNRKLLQK